MAFTLNPVDAKRSRPDGGRNQGGGQHRKAELPGESADYALWIQWAGDFADFVVWKPGDKVVLDMAPEKQVFGHLLAGGARRDAVAAEAALREVLPIRLAERWLELHPFKKWTNAAFEEAERLLHHFELVPAGTEGFAKAEVTAGGVDTDELSAQTMEAKKVPGLYFVARWWM